MIVLAVEFKIHPDNADQFRAAILKQAANSLSQEPDCLQFDVCFGIDDPANFFLYEKYTNQAAVDAHRKTPYFAEFRSAITPWVASKEAKSWQCDQQNA
jgi:quinol monooxygenase YgiN